MGKNNRRMLLSLAGLLLLACGHGAADSQRVAAPEETPVEAAEAAAGQPSFSADSAMAYLRMQTELGPRVPGTEAHRKAGDLLAAELRRHGAMVTEQTAPWTTFDGHSLTMRNIIGQYNPEAGDRLLLLAHWDCRPYADKDSDPEKRRQPVEGANDGASGVAVLLELARAIQASGTERGIDILFVDAEDWGAYNDDETWARGSAHFAAHPFKPGWTAREAILLDMVGAADAQFRPEYFSVQSNPALVERLWRIAAEAGYGNYFIPEIGGAITDDHVELIKAGIPAVNILDYRPETGFNPTWHTSADTAGNISPATLKAVGATVLKYIME